MISKPYGVFIPLTFPENSAAEELRE